MDSMFYLFDHEFYVVRHTVLSLRLGFARWTAHPWRSGFRSVILSANRGPCYLRREARRTPYAPGVVADAYVRNIAGVAGGQFILRIPRHYCGICAGDGLVQVADLSGHRRYWRVSWYFCSPIDET